MIGSFESIIIDCPDPRALARFYSELLGAEIVGYYHDRAGRSCGVSSWPSCAAFISANRRRSSTVRASWNASPRRTPPRSDPLRGPRRTTIATNRVSSRTLSSWGKSPVDDHRRESRRPGDVRWSFGFRDGRLCLRYRGRGEQYRRVAQGCDGDGHGHGE